MQLRPKPCNFATLMTYDVFRVSYLFESIKHKYSSAFEDKYEMKSFDDAELTACVLSKIDKNTIIIKQDIQRNSVLSTASSKYFLDHTASNTSTTTTWDKLMRNSYLFFPVDRQNRVRVFQGPPKVFRDFSGKIVKEITHVCLFTSPYSILSAVVTRVYSHEMQDYMKLCPILMF